MRIDSSNFIMHFGQRADEEFICEHRDELISTLVTQHEAVEGRPLQVFGLSSASLEDYLTSERDLANRITRMPTADYLLSKRKTVTHNTNLSDGQNNEWEEADDEELFDDFVLLEQPDMAKYNTSERITKEREQ